MAETMAETMADQTVAAPAGRSDSTWVLVLASAANLMVALDALVVSTALSEIRRDLGASIENFYRPLVLALQTMPMPVVCAVNGVAAGAGANIALACDLVVAAKSASFIQAFSKIGLIPDSGGTYFLPRLVGTARAMGLMMLGDKLSAQQAAEWGLIWRCVDDAELGPTVETLLAQLAQAPTKGLVATRRALHASAQGTLPAQLDLERDLQRELGYTADYREGVAAFLAKRPPQFTGR